MRDRHAGLIAHRFEAHVELGRLIGANVAWRPDSASHSPGFQIVMRPTSNPFPFGKLAIMTVLSLKIHHHSVNRATVVDLASF